jgi:hypothetical protein
MMDMIVGHPIGKTLQNKHSYGGGIDFTEMVEVIVENRLAVVPGREQLRYLPLANPDPSSA